MEKKRTFKSIIFVLIMLVIAIVVYFGYYFFSDKENPFLEIFNNNSKEDVNKDNKNGFYVYTELLGQSYSIFSGCTLNSIDMQYVVINDIYKLYRSSCLGSFFIEEGKTDDLDIKYDEEKKLFYLIRDGHSYYKKHEVMSLVPSNAFTKEGSKTINISSLKFILHETERPGEYYDIKEATLDGALNYNITVTHVPELEEYGDEMLYTYNLQARNFGNAQKVNYSIDFPTSIDNLPDVYSYGKILVVINPDKDGDRYAYNFRVFDSTGFTYDLHRQFPITINGHEITSMDNIYVAYISSSRTFKLLVSSNDTFCEDDSDSTDVAYYLFSIKYNYSSNNFDPPSFEKIGYKNEGCQYVNSLMGG